MSEGLDGGCRCGKVRYKITAPRANVVNCHCTTCRTMHGSAFTTYYVVANRNFALTAGDEELTNYAPSARGNKNFCRHCGTPVFSWNQKYPHLRLIHLGTLDRAAEITPNVNIFCRTQLPWVRVNAETLDYQAEIED